MKRLFRRAAMPHWAEFLVLLATIYPADRLYSLTVAGRFALWNEWLRPLRFTLGVPSPWASPSPSNSPLLHDTAEVDEGFWGPERVARLFPARGWVDLGVQVSAGSDFPVGQFGAMRSVWGMTTRQTVIGHQGPRTRHQL